ncbi:ArnT family glycosyltransferase [Tahibacter soli]|uniref:Glycosyltransferase family 39 protein n=1 Tax=Tahibacter soli TaxID=2983605 RepID=A0A9X3YP42_9GAMM|nr:glycosyltransferase family 39 protein [Tahibacter soli]MDC8015349.1 glycosyltransferase family 39 protein [Tahibacter soli]
MQGDPSVERNDDARRDAAFSFWTIWAASLAIKVWIAATLAPFGDEAFYWQESRALAWSYTDLPPLTAWLIRFGEAVCGHGEFGMRSAFLALGAAIPVLVYRLGARTFGERAGALAGIAWMLLPLGATLGALALPDVPLTFATVLALGALVRALGRDGIGRDRPADWLVLGVALALAWLSHYRAAMLLPAGLAVLAASAFGRPAWRRPGLWLALALGVVGLVPLVVFNARHHWSGATFQLVDRHPWRFQPDALVQPLEQAIVSTPLLYALMLYALWRCWRRRGEAAHWAVFAWTGIVLVGGYFAFGLFADDVRFRVHWPLPGYVPALVALPVVLDLRRRGNRYLFAAALALAAVGSAVALGYLAAAAQPSLAGKLADVKAFPENFVGWREAAARTRVHLDALRAEHGDAALVADNFLLAAELDFRYDGGETVYALDHKLNTKHGRAPQLALWRRDEAALADAPGRAVLLVVEESAGRERDKPAWLASLCRRVAGLTPVERLTMYGGRKVFAWYRGRVPRAGEASCGTEVDRSATQTGSPEP